jgi:hypothetical protein
MENLQSENDTNQDDNKTLIPLEIIKPFDEDQINAHAAKCGGRRNLREISVLTDDLEEFVYLVKKPSRAVLQAIAEESSKGDKKNITSIQKLMLGCVLEGDKDAFEHDGAIYTKLLTEISKLVRAKKSEIKKI